MTGVAKSDSAPFAQNHLKNLGCPLSSFPPSPFGVPFDINICPVHVCHGTSESTAVLVRSTTGGTVLARCVRRNTRVVWSWVACFTHKRQLEPLLISVLRTSWSPTSSGPVQMLLCDLSGLGLATTVLGLIPLLRDRRMAALKFVTRT